MAGIIIAGVSSFPFMLIGHQLTQTMSLASVLFGIFVGNLILWAVSVTTATMAARKRLNTVQLSRGYMLRTGSAITALAVLLNGVMWFVIQLHASSSAIAHVFSPEAASISTTTVRIGVILGLVTSGISLFGIRGIKWFNCLILIPIFLIIFYLIGNSPSGSINSTPRPFTFAAIAPIVATLLAFSVNVPTFLRHSASRKHTITALTFIYAYTATYEAVGISILSHFDTQQIWLTSSVVNGGAPFVPGLWLVFSIGTVIAINLINTYASSVGWEMLVPKVVGRKEYIIISLGSTLIFVLVQQPNAIILIAQLSNVALSNIGAVLTATYAMNKLLLREPTHQDKLACLITWIVAFTVGTTIEVSPSESFGLAMVSTAFGSFIAIVFYHIIRHIALPPSIESHR